MKIEIKKEVFNKYPQLRLVFFVLKKINNQHHLEESRHLLEEMENYVHLSFNKDNLKTHLLIAPWATAQQEFGPKAHHYHTSVERLMRKVFEHKSILTKDTLTNVLQYLCLKHIVPGSADDLEQVQGNLTFALAKGKEKVSLFAELKEKAFYYRDEKGVLGLKLDYWKSSRTRVGKNTTKALVHFGILPPLTLKQRTKLIQEAEESFKDFLQTPVKVIILNSRKTTAKI